MNQIFATAIIGSRKINFVLEELGKNNIAFWKGYLSLVKTHPAADEKTYVEEVFKSKLQADISHRPTDTYLALQGFENALKLLDNKPDKVKMYVAYATFDKESAYSEKENWKAINIQICMTVHCHTDLPFTTHMGIFADPFSLSTLPKSYKEEFEKRSYKKAYIEQYFLEKKVPQLSLYLHSFAFQACAQANPSFKPAYMVTKPIKSMEKIFKLKNLVEQSVKHEQSSTSGTLTEAMRRSSGLSVGYCISAQAVEIARNVSQNILCYNIMSQIPIKPSMINDRATSSSAVAETKSPVLGLASGGGLRNSNGIAKSGSLSNKSIESTFLASSQSQSALGLGIGKRLSPHPEANKTLLKNVRAANAPVSHSQMPSVASAGMFSRVAMQLPGNAFDASSMQPIASAASASIRRDPGCLDIEAPYILKLAFNRQHSYLPVFIDGGRLNGYCKLQFI